MKGRKEIEKKDWECMRKGEERKSERSKGIPTVIDNLKTFTSNSNQGGNALH